MPTSFNACVFGAGAFTLLLACSHTDPPKGSTSSSTAASSGHVSSSGPSTTASSSSTTTSAAGGSLASSSSTGGAGGAGAGGAGTGGVATGGAGAGGAGGCVGEGGSSACSVDGNPGTCEDTSVCAGMSGYTSTAGYCPGAANIECCTRTPNVEDNPPVPAGWMLMEQSMVTTAMTNWAVMILDDPCQYPMFATVMMTFGAQLVMARVEWHPPDFQNGVVHRGVTLYIPN